MTDLLHCERDRAQHVRISSVIPRKETLPNGQIRTRRNINRLMRRVTECYGESIIVQYGAVMRIVLPPEEHEQIVCFAERMDRSPRPSDMRLGLWSLVLLLVAVDTKRGDATVETLTRMIIERRSAQKIILR